MNTQAVFTFHRPSLMSCLRRGRTQRIREMSTLVGLSWLQAPPAPDVRISGRRFDDRNSLTILVGRYRRLSEQNGQDVESWIRITRIVVAPPLFVWIGPSASRDQENVNFALELAFFGRCQTRLRKPIEPLFPRRGRDQRYAGRRRRVRDQPTVRPARRSVRSCGHDRETLL